MTSKRPFAPAFIKKWDHKLLLNRPDTWSARAHLVFYYALFFMVALAGLCFIVPDDPRNRTQAPLWITLVSLISFIAFIVWLIYLLRFNVFKRFGNLEPLNGLKTFVLYFISIFLMVACTIIPPVVESIRANTAYTGKELVDDINAINTRVVQLERDSIPSKWDRDTFLVVNSIKGRDLVMEDEYYLSDTTSSGSAVLRRIIDTAEANGRIRTADSLQKLNDSLYVFFECPDYQFVSSYLADAYDPRHILSSVDLYHQVLVNYRAPDKQKTTQELHSLLKKYHPRIQDKFGYDPDEQDWDYTSRINTKYELWNANMSINHIAQRKYRWDETTISITSRILYYVTLGLTLLVFIFRRSSVRTFFLTLLAATLLTIITTLIIAFAGFDFIGSMMILILYYALFFIIAVVNSPRGIRSVVSGIALNLTTFITAFVPIMVVALYYALLRQKYRYKDEPRGLFDNEYEHLFYSEVVGLLLLLVLLSILFKKMYRAWFAMPEQ